MPDIDETLRPFRMTYSEMVDVDGNGNGLKLVYDSGVWRAWRLVGGREHGKSSGGWETPQEALERIRRMNAMA